MTRNYFSIGETVVIKDKDNGKKYEGKVCDVMYTGDVGTWYKVDYHVGNEKYIRTFHSWDLEKIDETK
jgi:hypothetical protein